MIVVPVVIRPQGRKELEHTIAVVRIENIGLDLEKNTANYNFHITQGTVTFSGSLSGFHRGNGAVELVRQVLNLALGCESCGAPLQKDASDRIYCVNCADS